MDPEANLQEQLRLAERIQRRIQRRIDSDASVNVNDANRLCELVLALNEWIVRGGFLPTDWRPRS